MFHCPRCEIELPEDAKFCNKCGLSQTNPMLVAIPQAQKDKRASKLAKKQMQSTSQSLQDHDTSATIRIETIRAVRTNTPIRNGAAAPPMQASLREARFTQNTGPLYLGRVVSIKRKRPRRNLLLTRAGLYLTLFLLTCLIIGIGFTIVYAVFLRPH